MKNLQILFLFLFLAKTSFSVGQIYDPVKWTYHAVKIDAQTYDLVFEASIENDWSIYSQIKESDDGPIPTSFNFENMGLAKVEGKVDECSYNQIKKFDKVFKMELIKFKKKAFFVQRISVEGAKPTKIEGWLEFMACTDKMCLPPTDADFKFDLVHAKDASEINYTKDRLCSGKQPWIAVVPPNENTQEKNEQKESSSGQVDAQVEKEKIITSKKITATKASPNTIANNKDQDTQPQIKEKQKSAEPTFEVVNKNEKADANTGMDQMDGNPQQASKHVKWTIAVKKINNQTFQLIADAVIADGWHIYSSTMDPDDGPIPTSINFVTEDQVVKQSKIEESAEISKTEYDKFFGMDVTKFKKKAHFTKEIKVVPNNTMEVEGYIEYMVCNDRGCLFPDPEEFSVTPDLTTVIEFDPNEEVNHHVSVDQSLLKQMFGLDKEDLKEPVGSCVVKAKEENSLMGIFTLGILGGLVALFTPCVFPMIPLTVSYFTKDSEKKKSGLGSAFFYGFSIFLIYILLSLPFHVFDALDPNILNDISTSVWLNLVFFAIFLFFAFSFFGYYELELPASISQRASSAEGAGGYLGIFFMALTLAIVSFSCTGPILGSLLAGTLQGSGSAAKLTAGMAGFGVSLGLPFGIFAAFPSLMNKLPKSGGWLNSVKVVLGFIELALAFKFLSNADLVKQWGILKIEPFLLIWIIIFAAMALYLFGKIKFPHDSPIKKLSAGRIGLGVLTVAFVLYLFTGFKMDDRSGTYKPLSLLSGLAPPVCYSVAHKCKCPQGLECYKDLQEGLAYAKSVNKPVMLDFTGHACVNCRKMEENVWPKSEIYPYLKDDFVLISLYVDEKLDLPEDEQIEVPRATGGMQKLRYTGKKWAFLQSEYFGKNTQPLYVLMTPDGKLLNAPVAYTPDVDEYEKFLNCGMENWNALGALGMNK